jgi:capsular polysaccharide biosynthesis protein
VGNDRLDHIHIVQCRQHSQNIQEFEDKMRSQRVTTFLRQWGWLILLGTAVAASTAYLINQNMTPVYEATTLWLIDEPAKSEAAQAASEGRLAQTYAALALTQPVLTETIERLALPFDETYLRSRVTAVAPNNTQLITIRVEDSDPSRAAHIANTIGDILADQSATRDSQRFAQPLANWQQQIDHSSAEIDTLQRQLAAANVTNRSQIESNLAEAQTRFDNAFTQLNNLLTQQAGESVIMTTIETAQTPTTPIRPRTAAATLWAAVAGGLAALIVAGFASRFGNEKQDLVTSALTTPPLTMTSND